MAFITWSDKLKIDIREIDEQHHRLVDLINELFDALNEQKADEVIDDTIEKMLEYVVYHFRAEEGFMEKFGFENIEAHKKAHSYFEQKAIDLLHLRRKGEKMVAIETMQFLGDWLKDHILGADKKLGHFLQSKGVS